MNIGLIACALPVPVLVVAWIAFALFKGKATLLISGFNTLSEREREQYDTNAMAKDMRNTCVLWTAILLLGCLASHFVSPYAAIVAYVVWLVLLLKDVRLNPSDAFGKYRL